MAIVKDTESGGDVKGFDKLKIRQAFVKKVYSILMTQLLTTFGIIAMFTLHEPTKMMAFSIPWLMYGCLIATFMLVIAMACCESIRRTTPINYIFLFLFTFAMAIPLGYVSALLKHEYIMFAVGTTVVICFALTLFAFQTKFDFIGMGTYLLIALTVLLIVGIVSIFWKDRLISLLYCSLGIIIFSFYLIYDTQLMIGGRHKYSISPEEYVFAALNLYLDIINLFMIILRIITETND